MFGTFADHRSHRFRHGRSSSSTACTRYALFTIELCARATVGQHAAQYKSSLAVWGATRTLCAFALPRCRHRRLAAAGGVVRHRHLPVALPAFTLYISAENPADGDCSEPYVRSACFVGFGAETRRGGLGFVVRRGTLFKRESKARRCSRAWFTVVADGVPLGEPGACAGLRRPRAQHRSKNLEETTRRARFRRRWRLPSG